MSEYVTISKEEYDELINLFGDALWNHILYGDGTIVTQSMQRNERVTPVITRNRFMAFYAKHFPVINCISGWPEIEKSLEAMAKSSYRNVLYVISGRGSTKSPFTSFANDAILTS